MTTIWWGFSRRDSVFSILCCSIIKARETITPLLGSFTLKIPSLLFHSRYLLDSCSRSLVLSMFLPLLFLFSEMPIQKLVRGKRSLDKGSEGERELTSQTISVQTVSRRKRERERETGPRRSAFMEKGKRKEREILAQNHETDLLVTCFLTQFYLDVYLIVTEQTSSFTLLARLHVFWIISVCMQLVCVSWCVCVYAEAVLSCLSDWNMCMCTCAHRV